MSEELTSWLKWISAVAGGFALLGGAILKFTQALIKLKIEESTQLRETLIVRVGLLEEKLDKSITDCEDRMRTLREEYEEKIGKLQAENYLLRTKLSSLATTVEEVNARTSGFTSTQLKMPKV